jgi:hypothetical protein
LRQALPRAANRYARLDAFPDDGCITFAQDAYRSREALDADRIPLLLIDINAVEDVSVAFAEVAGMQIHNSSKGYGAIPQMAHWLTVILSWA